MGETGDEKEPAPKAWKKKDPVFTHNLEDAELNKQFGNIVRFDEKAKGWIVELDGRNETIGQNNLKRCFVTLKDQSSNSHLPNGTRGKITGFRERGKRCLFQADDPRTDN